MHFKHYYLSYLKVFEITHSKYPSVSYGLKELAKYENAVPSTAIYYSMEDNICYYYYGNSGNYIVDDSSSTFYAWKASFGLWKSRLESKRRTLHQSTDYISFNN